MGVNMLFTYDNYKKLKQSLMFLANPQKEYIGGISDAENLRLTINFNDISKASFKIYESSELYSKVEKKRLVEIQHVAWFQIENVTERNDGLVAYKEVECFTLENELIGKRVDDIKGTFALYNILEPEYSLLHIISSASGWNIGHVDNELIGKWRTFSIDTEKVYNILTTNISKSFECIFQFDTYTRTINAYKLENLGQLTDIFISKRNLLKEYILESSSEIVTKLKVLGGDGFDIREVNPTGTNYLVNVDYYKVPISEGGWMTDGLINALHAYQSAYSNKVTEHTNLVNSLKALQSNLTALTSQLTDLESYKNAQDEIVGSYITMYHGAPPIDVPEYSSYLNALNSINSYVVQIADKKSEITRKENSIDSVKTALNGISLHLGYDNYFTSEQVKELDTFLTENEAYEDSTFTVTDIMSEDEITDMRIELMSNGMSELARVSRPQYTIKITAKNLFSLIDDSTMKIGFEKWRKQLSVGNLVTLSLRKDLCTTVRILSIEVDFDDLENMSLTLSDKSSLDDNTIQFEELLANAGKASSTLSLKQFGYDQASKITSSVRTFMNSTLNAATNAMINNTNVETEFGPYGIRNKKWLPDQQKYDDNQSWWNQNTLLFSDDGFKSSKTGIGLFTSSSGEKFYGVMADVICGQLIMGEQLSIRNSSGTYAINNNGITASAKVGANTYSVGINPSTPGDIFQIKINDSKKLYIDMISNKLIFGGDLVAAGGTFSGTVSGGSININNRFLVNSNGDVTLPDNATISWGQIKGTPTIIDKDTVTQISMNAISTANISCDQLKSGTISASLIDTKNLVVQQIKSNGMVGEYNINRDMSLDVHGGRLMCYTGTNYDAALYKTVLVDNAIYVDTTYANTLSARPKFTTINVNSSLSTKDISATSLTVSGSLSAKSAYIEGYAVVTTNTVSSYVPRNTSGITADVVDNSYIHFNGGNACGYQYAERTYQKISSSDVKLKYDINELKNSKDLIMGTKPKTYRFKDSELDKKVHAGVIAQELINLLTRLGIDYKDSGFIEEYTSRDWLGEGLYGDTFYRVNYEMFIPYILDFCQKMYYKIEELEKR